MFGLPLPVEPQHQYHCPRRPAPMIGSPRRVSDLPRESAGADRSRHISIASDRPATDPSSYSYQLTEVHHLKIPWFSHCLDRSLWLSIPSAIFLASSSVRPRSCLLEAHVESEVPRHPPGKYDRCASITGLATLFGFLMNLSAADSAAAPGRTIQVTARVQFQPRHLHSASRHNRQSYRSGNSSTMLTQPITAIDGLCLRSGILHRLGCRLQAIGDWRSRPVRADWSG